MQSMEAEALEVLQASLRSDDERMRLEAVKITLPQTVYEA